MKKVFIRVIVLGALLNAINSNAQDYNSKVKGILADANDHYDHHEVEESLKEYLSADAMQPKDGYISYRIAFLYVYQHEFTKALPFLEAAKKSNFISDSIDFMLGRAYHLSHKFEDAKKSFAEYLKTPDLSERKVAQVNQMIKSCNSGIELIKKPVAVKITNLGDTINSQFPDYLPLISANENTLIFTSRRENSTGSLIDGQDHGYFEDIYITNKDDGKWTKPVSAGRSINSANHDAAVTLSADGQEMFVYRGDMNGGDLFISDLKGTEWTKPLKLNKYINTQSWEQGGSISTNEKILYFTSNRSGGTGGTDIYFSVKGANGEFGPAKLLGLKINTALDENSPYIHADGKTLYFSSQGHNSMGGFDIFSVTINPETGDVMSEPENLGYPINTADDDVYFVWSADGKRAYFSSRRDGGHGDKDIYMLERPIKETPLVVLEGTVRDCETQQPLEAVIEATDNGTGKIAMSVRSNSSSGKFTLVLPDEKNYGIMVRMDVTDYIFYSKNIDNTSLHSFKTVMDKLCLEKVKTGQKMILKNVFFDTDKSHLREESFVELKKLVSFLNDHPQFSAKIEGHTDSDGSDEHNLKLSADRASSVADYVKSKGIDPKRLTFEGRGESEPNAPNDTEANKQLNRRTEVEFY